LKCFFDNADYYKWSVRAKDNEGYGGLTANRTIKITSLVEISLPENFTNFGSMLPGVEKNTSSGTPNPFIVMNNGNCLSNISLNSTSIWDSVLAQMPSEYYMSKIRNYSGNATWANTSWFQLPPITGLVSVIDRFNYKNSNNTLGIDMLLKVPADESPGGKSSTINFEASLAE